MSACTCPRVDGYRIRSKGCPTHSECLDSIGPVPKLDGATFVCTKPVGHELPHESPDGTWWEPPVTPEVAKETAYARGRRDGAAEVFARIQTVADELTAAAAADDAEYEVLTERHGAYGKKKERAFLRTASVLNANAAERIRAALPERGEERG